MTLLKNRTIRADGNYFMVQVGFTELYEALEDKEGDNLKELLLDIKECMHRKLLEQERKR